MRDLATTFRTEHDRVYVGGAWRPSRADRALPVECPIDGSLFGVVPECDESDVEVAVRAARDCFDQGPWRSLGLDDRITRLAAFAELLDERSGELTWLQIGETGGPRSFVERATQGIGARAREEIATARATMRPEIRDGRGGPTLVLQAPVGVVAAIVPWNAPVGLLLNKLLPALLAGCSVVVKAPPEAPLTSFVIAQAAHEAGFPPGVVNVLVGGVEVGRRLVGHAGVDAVSFTGSVAVGSEIGAVCGRQVKRAVLELGGKSPAIVLDDADLDVCVPLLVERGLANNGAVCFATTRILALADVYDALAERLVSAVQALRIGDPYDPSTDIGPLITRGHRAAVEDRIASAVREGAALLVGGERPAQLEEGWFLAPAVLAVHNRMEIAQREVFGPVLTLIRCPDEAEAIRLANESDFGLAAGVYTGDLARGLSCASLIASGMCSINAGSASGGSGPFGGLKRSGLGRERGREGLEEFLEPRSITIPADADLDMDDLREGILADGP
ncbi:MAG TPA: aldehyde dehydrogenase family protein [Acidimicrobiales bacterium]|nr:aldehyde dehydrogenase family protein [Acidimicrobiales bacterium]